MGCVYGRFFPRPRPVLRPSVVKLPPLVSVGCPCHKFSTVGSDLDEPESDQIKTTMGHPPPEYSWGHL